MLYVLFFVYLHTSISYLMKILKRIYIWLKRFRFRRGYGVHSPFAYRLITDVVYERHPYYAYRELKALRSLSKHSSTYAERVDKLLFRLVNRFAPQRVLEVGTGSGLSLCYLASARVGTKCVSLPGEDISSVVSEIVDRFQNISIVPGPLLEILHQELSITPQVDMLHIAHTSDYSQVFEKFLACRGEKKLVVIEGIYETEAKHEWWNQVVADERTGITFDLYDLGLVFFDHQKNKQHYVVNF